MHKQCMNCVFENYMAMAIASDRPFLVKDAYQERVEARQLQYTTQCNLSTAIYTSAKMVSQPTAGRDDALGRGC
jgi:hypothetical protein